MILENNKTKIFLSPNYHYVFDKTNGYFARWGQIEADDPVWSPFGPEIADIEISTICSGVNSNVCKYCYKSNSPDGKWMSFDTFRILFNKLPKTITQIAFGIGDIEANPDIWMIFDYCRSRGVIPNVTVNGEGISNRIAAYLVSHCGAVAVSVYDKNKSYDTVKKLTDLGSKQVNIHQVIHQSNFEFTQEVVQDIVTDSRLKELNAIVFLSLKPKGRGKNSLFQPLSQEKFTELIQICESLGISFGMDSCSAGKFIKTIESYPNQDKLLQVVEPCESTKFSSYINVEGKFYPCSFMENEGDWTEGLDVLSCSDFIKDIWMNEKTIKFRNQCIECTSNNRGCPNYVI